MTPAACSHQRFLFIFSSFRGLFFKVKVIKMRRILLYHIADEIFIFVIDLDLIGKTGLNSWHQWYISDSRIVRFMMRE